MVQKSALASESNQAHYVVISRIGFFEDYGEYRTYGLLATQKVREGWHINAEIHDITTDLNAALDIAHAFNHHGLSMVHFNEAIEDWLSRDSF